MSRLLLRLFEAVERNSSFRCCGFIPLPLLNGLDPDRSLRLIVPEYVYGCTQRCTAIILGAGSINAGAGVVIVFSCPSTFGALCFFLQIRPLSSAVCAFLFCARPIYKAARNAHRSALNELKHSSSWSQHVRSLYYSSRAVSERKARKQRKFSTWNFGGSGGCEQKPLAAIFGPAADGSNNGRSFIFSLN